ncbi:hypothetical protein [Polyangium jinanense]|uniref:Uncharacterized protein n=1 Tax=Polyangium jinanense TaxID=2829994 RepID=A0A9X3XAS9_9BACT|nr:hypothetical protein [Polyangium jinanense]MDC3957607.1 hypothetical protein [Polyangium jinanense]MDC3984611.1 hypothetical protein [Polyangium jinanense]
MTLVEGYGHHFTLTNRETGGVNTVKYDELESLLRNWGGDPPYDFVGMFHLFRACVLNLTERSTEADWSEVYEFLEPPERNFLERLVRGFQSRSFPGEDAGPRGG